MTGWFAPYLVAVLLVLAGSLMLAAATSRDLVIPKGLLILSLAIPVIFLFGAIDGDSDQFDRLRVRLTHVDMPPAAPLRIGPGDGDDLVVEGLDAVASVADGRFLRVAPAATSDARVAPPDPAIFGYEIPKRWNRPARSVVAGAVPLDPGDRFCLAACDGADGLRFAVGADGRTIRRLGVRASALPPLHGKDRLRDRLSGFPEYRAGQAIFPLRDYGIAGTVELAPARSPCGRRWLCDPRTARPLRSFLFFGDGRRLSIALLDPGAVVAGKAPAPALRIPPGARIAAWQARFAGADADLKREPRASILRKRIELGVASHGGGTRYTLGDYAPVVSISNSQIAAILTGHSTENGAFVTLEGRRPVGANDDPANVARFERIGGSLAEVLGAGGGDPLSLRFSGTAAASGRNFPGLLGATAPEVAHDKATFARTAEDGAPPGIGFEMERLEPQAWMRLLVIAWSVVLGCALFGPLGESRAVGIVVCLVPVLLSFRYVVAIGAPLFDDGLNARALLGDALVAYSAVPTLLLALFAGRRRAPEILVAAALLCGATVWLAATRADAGYPTLAFGAVATVVVLIAALPMHGKLLDLAGWFSGARAWLPGSVWTWLIFAGLLAALRVGVGVIAGTEQVGYLRLSLVYLPLALLVAAGLVASFRAAPSVAALFAACLGIGLLFAVVPWAMSDKGFGLIYLFPVGVLLAQAAVPWALEWHPLSLAAGCAATAAAVIALYLAGTLVVAAVAGSAALLAVIAWSLVPRGKLRGAAAGSPAWALSGLLCAASLAFAVLAATYPFASTAATLIAEAVAARVSVDGGTAGAADLDTRLARFSELSNDDWRIEAVFRPERISDGAVIGAEQARRVRFMLEDLTRQTFANHFPYEARISEIRANQTNDNLSAVFLMAPYGRAAGAAFIAMLALAMVAVWRAPQSDRTASPVLLAWAQLCLAAFVVAGCYMILANLQLLPFTGRDVYLLSAASANDIYEGTLLLVIALWGFAARDRIGGARQG